MDCKDSPANLAFGAYVFINKLGTLDSNRLFVAFNINGKIKVVGHGGPFVEIGMPLTCFAISTNPFFVTSTQPLAINEVTVTLKARNARSPHSSPIYQALGIARFAPSCCLILQIFRPDFSIGIVSDLMNDLEFGTLDQKVSSRNLPLIWQPNFGV
jgi:hypothetical protein